SNAPSLVPAPSPIDRLVLEAGLDFVCHKDGMIELTEAGFRRMGQAHSAGLDTVIEVDRRYLLFFPASPALRIGFSADSRRSFLPARVRHEFIWKAAASVVASGLQPSPGNPMPAP